LLVFPVRFTHSFHLPSVIVVDLNPDPTYLSMKKPEQIRFHKSDESSNPRIPMANERENPEGFETLFITPLRFTSPSIVII